VGPGLHPTTRLIAVLLGILAALVSFVRAAEEPKQTVASVGVEGNLRVEQDAIKVLLRTQPGQPYDPALLDADIRAIYGMGFFDQVDADVTEAGDHEVAVVFRVKERPLVRAVKVEGTDEIEKEEVEGALKIRPRTILDPEKARQGIEAAKKLYVDKGYLDATITYTTTVVGENEVDVLYKVDEKGTIKIEEIGFEGNEAFSSRTLRGVMQTREGWIFGFLTGAGVLSRDVLRTDVERLTAYYYDHGYVTVKVDEPIVERKDDGLYITIKIAEGDQFKIGKVDIVGADLPPDSIRLREGIETTTGEVFSASALREDSQKLTERLSEDGYAFATVEPQTAIDEQSKTVDITFQADRGKPVVIDRIEIEGNTKTRDKVIRREMRLQEQELFSARKLRKSRESLQRLGLLPGGEHHHRARGGRGPHERRRGGEGGPDGRRSAPVRGSAPPTRCSSTSASRRTTSSAAASASS
jgi:outer membrane protein insertion porin family